MNLYLLASAVLMVGLAVVHSVLGEIKIFRHIKDPDELPHLKGFPLIRKNDYAAKLTIRMVWHLITVMALALTAILFHLSLLPSLTGSEVCIVKIIGASMFASFIVSLIISKGSHVAWIAFLLIGTLCIMGVL